MRKARNILSDPQEIAKAIFFGEGMSFPSSQKTLGRYVDSDSNAEKLVIILLFKINLFNSFNCCLFVFFMINSALVEKSKDYNSENCNEFEYESHNSKTEHI